MLQRLNLGILSFISAWLIRHRLKQENFMSRCCINFTLQLMQLKHISNPSVFKATNNAVEIRLNTSDRFLYMQHISGHHLSIRLISQIICSNIIFHLSTHAKLLLSSIYIYINIKFQTAGKQVFISISSSVCVMWNPLNYKRNSV